jgi:hypothetical protein
MTLKKRNNESLRCQEGHSICTQCGNCHPCWGWTGKPCAELEDAIEQIEAEDFGTNGYDFQKAVRGELPLPIGIKGTAVPKKENQVGHKNDGVAKPVNSVWFGSECEYDTKEKMWVTKIGRFQVE